MTSRLILLVALILLMIPLQGRAAPNAKRIYTTQRIAGPSPVVDGHLDDAAWEAVAWDGRFIQREPYDGNPPSQPTEIKILYDDNALYIAYRAHDTAPDKIEERLARRDHFPGDWVEVNIDSYFDKRTAFSFTLSVSGAKGDEFISEDGMNWDTNWDPIWYGAAACDAQGWTAEMKIPFSQLRYSDQAEQVWGIQFTRRIFRQEERSTWQPMPQDEAGWVSRFGELHGLRGIRPQRQIELAPYVVAQAERYQREGGNPFATGCDNRGGAGLDGKIGLTGNLMLDFTVNPDFGQVEADPSVVNLTAFETYFQEKRPFFIEGNNIVDFRVAPAITGGSFVSDNLFYSRRIGRAPTGAVSARDGEYDDVPTNTTILGACKLTGKTSGGLSIGLLESVTAEERADLKGPAGNRQELVEPLTNYLLARVRQDFGQGQTIIGGMLTATHRRLPVADSLSLHRAAYTGGLDFLHYMRERAYYISATTLFSHVSGEDHALAETQASSARYYQRPDADYVDYDETRTSLSGHGGSARIGKESGCFLFQTGAAWRSPGLELNDVGYMRSADGINQFSWVGYRIRRPIGIFREVGINGNEWLDWDFGGRHLGRRTNLNSHMTFKNNWRLNGGVTRVGDHVSNTELRGGPACRWPGGVEYSIEFDSDERRRFSVGAGASGYEGDEGSTLSRNRSAWFSCRASSYLSISLNPSYSTDDVELSHIGSPVAGGETHYVFGTLNQKTAALTFRWDLCLTPNLTVQYYGQPFVSGGEYSAYKEIANPMARAYTDRFRLYGAQEILDAGEIGIDSNGDGAADYTIDNPNFDIKEFNSNLVIRWEFKPGARLYLVWSQGRSSYGSSGAFSWRDDTRDLFNLCPHDVFLIKVNWWGDW